MENLILLLLYYSFAIYLPASYSFWPFGIGKISRQIRYLICKRIFSKCGNDVNVERCARFGNGSKISIHDNSGLGINCSLEGPISIGQNVMMGANTIIIRTNHNFFRIDIPMNIQGFNHASLLEIDDDVWIGTNVIILPGCHKIARGSVIGAGSIVSRDVTEYSVVGGNPARMIKKRKKRI